MRSSPAGRSDGGGLGGRRRDPRRRRPLRALRSCCLRPRSAPRRSAPRCRRPGHVGRRPFDVRRPRHARLGGRGREARIVAPIGAFEAVGPVRRSSATAARCVSRNGSPAWGSGASPARGNRVVLLPAARVVADGRTTAAPTVSIAVVPRVPAAVVAARDPAYRRQTEIPPAALLAAADRPRRARRRRSRRCSSWSPSSSSRRGFVAAPVLPHRGGRVRARRSASAGVAGAGGARTGAGRQGSSGRVAKGRAWGRGSPTSRRSCRLVASTSLTQRRSAALPIAPRASGREHVERHPALRRDDAFGAPRAGRAIIQLDRTRDGARSGRLAPRRRASEWTGPRRPSHRTRHDRDRRARRVGEHLVRDVRPDPRDARSARGLGTAGTGSSCSRTPPTWPCRPAPTASELRSFVRFFRVPPRTRRRRCPIRREARGRTRSAPGRGSPRGSSARSTRSAHRGSSGPRSSSSATSTTARATSVGSGTWRLPTVTPGSRSTSWG